MGQRVARGATVRRGVERLLAGEAPHLRGLPLGLIAHPASVTDDLTHSATALLDAGFDVRALFGPQHGARGEKQDNMVESAPYTDPVSGLPVHSLYGDVRRPTPEMLRGLEGVLFDLQDVGVRVYTFVWTMALAMEACAEAGIRFVVLDRPNPIGGHLREGPMLRAGFESFVGLHTVPLRHGLTCGELASWLNTERGIGCDLEVVACDGWRRATTWEATGLSWVLPSPNLPTPDSCAVYPGMVLLEGTNLSEGRGTTRPFEVFGAPYVDAYALERRLHETLGPGVTVRPCHFEPTFQKHAGRMCGGGQIHVSDVASFRSVHTAVAILVAVKALAPDAFEWRSPPYEYETVKPPIDILWGSDALRRAIDRGESAESICEAAEAGVDAFSAEVAPYLLYD
jgi:uncharacterized protein YbbC (DUF1343 family)